MVLKVKTPTKTIGQADAASDDLVTTATLVRGRVYFYKNMRFDLGVAVVVTPEIADILEDEVEVVADGDREEYEKPYFDIARGVPRPAIVRPQDSKPERRRLPVRPLVRR